jgi:hypothetical protein
VWCLIDRDVGCWRVGGGAGGRRHGTRRGEIVKWVIRPVGLGRDSCGCRCSGSHQLNCMIYLVSLLVGIVREGSRRTRLGKKGRHRAQELADIIALVLSPFMERIERPKKQHINRLPHSITAVSTSPLAGGVLGSTIQ